MGAARELVRPASGFAEANVKFEDIKKALLSQDLLHASHGELERFLGSEGRELLTPRWMLVSSVREAQWKFHPTQARSITRSIHACGCARLTPSRAGADPDHALWTPPRGASQPLAAARLDAITPAGLHWP